MSYLFNQDSKAHGRSLKLYLNSKAVKWINQSSELSVYARAPDWQVFVCNDAKKLFFSCKPERFQGHLNYMATYAAGVVIQELPLKLVANKTYMKLPCSLYTLDGLRFKRDKYRENFDAMQLIHFNDKSISSQAASLIRRIYGTPEAKGIPLYFSYVKTSKKSSKRKTRQILKTLQIKRVAMFPVNKGAPKGYKRVKSEQDLSRNSSAEAGMNLLLGK